MRTRFRQERLKKGLTQKQLAEMVEISEIMIRKIESGERNPSIPLMIRLEQVLGIDMKELFPDIFSASNDTKCII